MINREKAVTLINEVLENFTKDEQFSILDELLGNYPEQMMESIVEGMKRLQDLGV